MKPRMFVGSSSENLEIAWAVQANLSRDAEVTVWDQDVFKQSRTSLESLIETLDKSDFGVFIFCPEDLVEIRGEENRAVRDNVLLELGFFLGRLGRDRCFILVPEDASELRIPTDLIGFTPAIYETDRSDSSWQAATGPACNSIRQAMQSLGQKSEEAKAPDVGSKSSESSIEKEVETEVMSQSSQHGEQPDSSEEEFAWIFQYIDKKYERSLELLEEKISSVDDDEEEAIFLESWVGRVMYYLNSVGAVQHLESLMEKYPESSLPYLQLFRTFVDRDLYDKGLDVIELGLAKCVDRTDLTLAKISFLQERGDEQESSEALQNAILDSPQTAKYYIAEADYYIEKTQYEDARVSLDRANQEVPDNEDLLLAYAKLQYDQFDRKLALIPYSLLLRLNPDNVEAITLRANLLLDLGLNDLAMRSYQRANELSEGKRDWILGNIGNLYKNRGLYGEAIRYLKLALDQNSDHQFAHERLAVAIKLNKAENEELAKILKDAKKSLVKWKPGDEQEEGDASSST
ncbi:MAG: nucleotide-binding protein [Chloroflexi bacterium]|nr:nucleotide-binding protein [Chloroflexota bacterium]